MGYRVWIHEEVGGWLTALRRGEPERARQAGEAVLALLEEGGTLGPPLVVTAESVLTGELDDPRQALDATYQRQLETLARVRRGVADVATSRKRLELQAGALEQQAAKLSAQRARALGAGRDDLAREAAAREAAAGQQLADVRGQMRSLAIEEERLTAASQRLAAKVDAFRFRKETIKATWTAAEAARAVREADAVIDAGAASGTGQDDVATGGQGAAAVAGEEAPAREGEDGDGATGGEAGDEEAREGETGVAGEGEDGAAARGVMELRLGDPGGAGGGLLFALEPPGTAVLLAHAQEPGRSRQVFAEARRTAAARLALARSRPAAGPAVPAAFASYDAESFLDEFFPGEEAEVAAGAGALAARYRAHTLAQARQRMGLSQAQVAQRMNVRQERVSAIERAEPGAAEVATLAAYVRALGGTLEITAHVGGERIVLR